MKKLISILLVSLILAISVIPVIAADAPFVLDDAEILTDEERNELSDYLKSYTKKYGFGFYVVTKEYTEGDIESYTDDFYDYNNYGVGEDKNGIMILLDMSDRQLHITTTGDEYIYVLQAYISEFIDAFIDNLNGNDYMSGFKAFADISANIVEQINNGDIVFQEVEHDPSVDIEYYDDYDYDYDYDYNHGSATYYGDISLNIVIVILIALVLSFITCMILKSKNKTVRFTRNADRYEETDTFKLSYHQDRFMYRTLNKTARAEENHNNHSGGGSSGGIHVGSSGTSHGGGSAHF